jgi:hypothetical protein
MNTTVSEDQAVLGRVAAERRATSVNCSMPPRVIDEIDRVFRGMRS